MKCFPLESEKAVGAAWAGGQEVTGGHMRGNGVMCSSLGEAEFLAQETWVTPWADCDWTA
ncbi:hypothetical protein TRAPUB_6367 [Trametes pubescens]|uniref:Uncharacterized protein n=1 Tax=Trametes pubescens TaxID=154538 RepID=A0A1M2V624_TRAPU|nr:hypothetical protein TRAPUB_6367 [Trametes pubescens]